MLKATLKLLATKYPKGSASYKSEKTWRQHLLARDADEASGSDHEGPLFPISQLINFSNKENKKLAAEVEEQVGGELRQKIGVAFKLSSTSLFAAAAGAGAAAAGAGALGAAGGGVAAGLVCKVRADTFCEEGESIFSTASSNAKYFDPLVDVGVRGAAAACRLRCRLC